MNICYYSGSMSDDISRKYLLYDYEILMHGYELLTTS